jgi:lipopolysaccharide export system permease protein
MINPKILHRYIFSELAGPFALGLFVFTFLLLMQKIMPLVDMLVNKGVTFGEVSSLIWYLLPSFLVLTLPMSILLAILISLGKFSSDAELMAMKASGVSLYQMLPPFVLLCVAGFFFTNALTLYLLPKGNYAFRTELVNIAKKHSDTDLEAGIFIDNFEGFVLYINSFDKDDNKVHGIFIIDKRDPKQQTIIVGNTATIFADQNDTTILFKLENGTIHRFDPKSLNYQYALFNNYDMNVPLQDINDEGDFKLKYKEMDFSALWNLSGERRAKKLSDVAVNMEMSKRLAFPFACLVFGILGVSVGSFWRRGGRSYGFILSIVIVFCYYLLLSMGENLAKTGWAFAFTGVWLPNILLGTAGTYLFFKASREKPLPAQMWIDRRLAPAIGAVVQWLKQKLGRG